MKNRKSLVIVLALLFVACMAVPCFASGNVTTSTPDLSGAIQPVLDLINYLFKPAITIVVSLGTLYCIILGVKFARAEEPQDREKAKQHLKNAIIGFVLIFVLMVVINQLAEPLTTWVVGLMYKGTVK